MKRRSFVAMLASLFGWGAGGLRPLMAEVIDHGPKIDNGPAAKPKPPAKTSPAPMAYDPDHRCDKCGHQSLPGQGTWIVRGSVPGGGHTHACPKCGHTWQHGGHLPFTLPRAASGCPNGNCPRVTR